MSRVSNANISLKTYDLFNYNNNTNFKEYNRQLQLKKEPKKEINKKKAKFEKIKQIYKTAGQNQQACLYSKTHDCSSGVNETINNQQRSNLLKCQLGQELIGIENSTIYDDMVQQDWTKYLEKKNGLKDTINKDLQGWDYDRKINLIDEITKDN